MKRFFSADVDFDSEEVLEILDEAGVVEETAAGFPGDEKVQVAAFVGLTAGHRAEDAEVVSAAEGREAEDLFAAFGAEGGEGEHGSIVR